MMFTFILFSVVFVIATSRTYEEWKDILNKVEE